MWALIAFIILGIVVAALIEINERVKSRKTADAQRQETASLKDESMKTEEDCQQKQPSEEACSGCDLLSVCEKKTRNVSD